MRSSSRRAFVFASGQIQDPPAATAPRRLPKPPRRPQRKGRGGQTPPGRRQPRAGPPKVHGLLVFFLFLKKIRGIKLFFFFLQGTFGVKRLGLSADIGQRQFWIRLVPAPMV